MSDYIKQISSGGLVYPLKDEEARNDIYDLFEIENEIYYGRDMTEVFADEIKSFSDPWAWIKSRINQGDYSGLRKWDYIPMTLSGGTGETHEMQININTFKGSGDSGYEIPDHIDFISRDCYSEEVQYNTTNNNNGNASESNPFLASNLATFFETLYGYLPQAVKNQITEKRTYVEERYTSGSTLTDSTSRKWASIGKVWPLTEVEVFGYVSWGTKGYSDGIPCQYPVFKGGVPCRQKGAGPGGSRSTWWLMPARSGASTSVCYVTGTGCAYIASASTECRVPICFRIAADA